MKQFHLAIVLIFLSSSVSSQIGKGQWLVGGNASFSHAVVKQNNGFAHSDNKTTGFQLMPGAGYFFIRQLAAGLRGGITHSDIKQESNSSVGPVSFYYLLKSKTTGLSFSPFVRYYFLAPSQKPNDFSDISYAYNNNKENTNTYQQYIPPGGLPTITSSITNSKYKSHSYSIAAGPAFFMNPKV